MIKYIKIDNIKILLMNNADMITRSGGGLLQVCTRYEKPYLEQLFSNENNRNFLQRYPEFGRSREYKPKDDKLDKFLICIDSNLFNIFNYEEIKVVAYHEYAHLINKDYEKPRGVIEYEHAADLFGIHKGFVKKEIAISTHHKLFGLYIKDKLKNYSAHLDMFKQRIKNIENNG